MQSHRFSAKLDCNNQDVRYSDTPGLICDVMSYSVPLHDSSPWSWNGVSHEVCSHIANLFEVKPKMLRKWDDIPVKWFQGIPFVFLGENMMKWTKFEFEMAKRPQIPCVPGEMFSL